MAKQKRKIVVGDCETDPFKFGRIPAPFIWCIFDGEEYHIFDTAKEMIEFLKDKNWIVYMHNGGKFDYHFILEYLEPYSPIMDINGRLSRFKIGECEFRDSYNIIPQPLAAYKKDDFDYNKMEKDVRHLHMRDIIKYLKNDCLFLYELVTAFIDTYGINLTLASAAFKFWNKTYNPHENLKTDRVFYDDFKKFYYGGRVECFKKGIIDHDLICVDINSAYPFAMLHDHPYGSTYDTLDYLPDEGIERCFIELEGIAQGCFPYRGEDKRLYFPNDEIKRNYFVTGWEFENAITFNALHDYKIKRVYKFIQRINFSEYVNHFYNIKNSAPKGTPNYIIAKLFLNSLYGKYAANPEKYTETFIAPQSEILDACAKLEMEYAGDLGQWAILQRPLPPEKQVYYNVATAASITGFVRAYLFQAMQYCDDVVYCDTDSLFCRKADLNFNDKLGGWDIEGEFIRGAIGGKKLYAFEDKNGKFKTGCKGARLNAQEILRVCSGEKVLYKSHAPTFSLKRGNFFLEREIKMT